MKRFVNINKAAIDLGIPVHTLRRWSNKGMIESHRFTENGWRWFKKEDLNLLKERVANGRKKEHND